MIAYRRDKFQELGWTPQDWGDLWRTELKGKISLLDQPREIIGLTLKKLGKSYNTQNLAKIPSLKAELQALNHQAKFYSSDRYLQPLILEDTWAAVGWSSDLLPLVKRNPQIAAVIPQSGTALWADLWVYPQGREFTPGAKSWIDFCWQPATANRIGLLSSATSPMIPGMRTEELLPDLRSNPLLVPPMALIDRSEFLEPLPETAMTAYLTMWKEIRQRV
jgi:putative spermidine/putrescine transport system substrate-binding protein